MKRAIPAKVAERIGWALLAVILIVAIIYFNVIYQEPVVEGYEIGEKCPDFELLSYVSAGNPDGGTFSSASARGQVLVLNFWYVNCGGCNEELPHFNEVQEEYGDQVKIVAVHSSDVDTDKDKQAFIDSTYSDFKVTFAQDTAELNLFKKLGGKRVYPITIIIDKEGVIRYVRQNKMSKAELAAEIDKLL